MTPNDIRRAQNKLIVEQCPWEIATSDTTDMVRTLYYICGLVDMTETICEMMEGKQI